MSLPVSFSQSKFNAGILSPIALGNVDSRLYNYSLQSCQNFIQPITGGFIKRQGTSFVASMDDILHHDTRNPFITILEPSFFLYNYYQNQPCAFFYRIDINDPQSHLGNPRLIYGVVNSTGEVFFQGQCPIYLISRDPQYRDQYSVIPYSSENRLFLSIKYSGPLTQQLSDSRRPPYFICSFQWNPIHRNFDIYPNLRELNLQSLLNDDVPAVSGNLQDFVFAPLDFPEPSASLILTELNNDNSKWTIPAQTQNASVIFRDDSWHNIQNTNDPNDNLNVNFSPFAIQTRTNQNEDFFFNAFINPDLWNFPQNFSINKTLDTDWMGKLIVNNAYTYWSSNGFSLSRGGFPSSVGFFENRLIYGRGTKLWISSSGNSVVLVDFKTGSNDRSAIMINIASNNVSQIYWIFALSSLFVGTDGGIFITGNNSTVREPITPRTNLTRISSIVPSDILPISSQDGFFFTSIDRSQVLFCSLASSNIFQVSSVSTLSSSLLSSGITNHTFVPSLSLYLASVLKGHIACLSFGTAQELNAWSTFLLGGHKAEALSLTTLTDPSLGDFLLLMVNRPVPNDRGEWHDQLVVEHMKLENEIVMAESTFLDCSKTLIFPFPFSIDILPEEASIDYLIPLPSPQPIWGAFYYNRWNPQNTVFALFPSSNPDETFLRRVIILPDNSPLFVICDLEFPSSPEAPRIAFFSRPEWRSLVVENAGDEIHLMFDQDADILNEHAVVFLNNNHPILDFYHSHLVFNLDAVYAEGVDDPPLLYYTVTAEIPIVADVEGMINVDLALNYEGPPLHYQPGNPACASTDLLPPHQDYFLDEFSWDLDEQNRHVLNQQHVSVRQIRLPDVVADVSGLFSPYGDWPFDATHLLFNHISGVAFQKMNDINCNVNFQFLAHQNISIIANDDARYVHSFDDFDPHQILHYPEAVYKVTAGIPFTSSFTTTPMEWCSDSMALQSTLSKQKHSFGAMLQLYKSRGGKIGNHPDFLYPIPYGSLVAMNRPADAFTGRVLSPLPDNTSNQPYESCLIVSHDEPFSFNILSVTRNINVNE